MKQLGAASVEFISPKLRNELEWEVTVVPCVQLESLIAMRPAHKQRSAVVKMDVEGMDTQVRYALVLVGPSLIRSPT